MPTTRLATILAPLVLLAQCQRGCSRGRAELGPEDVLQGYLDVAFNMESLSDKAKLLSFTSGPLEESIASSSDEEIRKAYIQKKFKLERYSLVEKRERTPRETEIVFEVVYKNLASEGPDDTLTDTEIPTVKSETTVLLVKKRQSWYLYDVLNKKTTFDFPTSVAGTEVKPRPEGERTGDPEEEEPQTPEAEGEGEGKE
jgi:hypothetical protein